MNISISTLIIFGTVFLMGEHVLARTLETGSPEDAGRLLFFGRRDQGGQTGGGEVVPSGCRTGERGSPEDAGRLLFFLETELGKIKEKP